MQLEGHDCLLSGSGIRACGSASLLVFFLVFFFIFCLRAFFNPRCLFAFLRAWVGLVIRN